MKSMVNKKSLVNDALTMECYVTCWDKFIDLFYNMQRIPKQ